jgi:uncharacterized protein
MAVIVVSDTSPIRALAHLGLFDLLGQLFAEVWVPPAVADELARVGLALSPAPAPWLKIAAPRDRKQVEALALELDAGESEALALAIEIGSHEILIDERAGRRVALRLGLEPVGVIGLLVRAKARGVVPSLNPLLDRLRSELGFFISDALRAEALRLAGE